jgi:hypothetical protein
MTDRDGNEFLEPTKRAVALRAGHRCSLTGCGQLTVGPSEESPSAITNIGVAAHICAASPKGKRYDASMTPEQRSDISNAIGFVQITPHSLIGMPQLIPSNTFVR